MQCTSFTPVYYHARDLNVGANGYSWHLYDSNSSYGEERGYNISMPPFDQNSGYNKEVMKQIIQHHEATFRYQVQELHRLYRRQRHLMDEMRMRKIFANHLLSSTSETIHSLSHARAEVPQNRSLATNWLFGNLASELAAGHVRGPENLVAENLDESTTLRTDSLIRKNSTDNVQFLSPCCKQKGDEWKQFKVGNLSEAHELERRTPAYSDCASTKKWDFSSSSPNIRKINCFIDLNEPIQPESLPTSSAGPLDTFTSHNKTVCSGECVPVEAVPESIILAQSQLLKSDDGSSDGINSSMAIDLNSMPVNYFSESEMTLKSPRYMNREGNIVLDCSSPCNHNMRNGKCSEHEPIVHNKISNSFLKTETCINLNTRVVDQHFLPLSSSTLPIKSAEDTELKGPVSPENEERSPPRGKSEDIQLETPLSFEGEGEPFITIAAETLANMGAEELYPLANFRNLCWFAEFVSSTGDDLENEVMKLENDPGKEKTLNSSCFNKAKGTGTMSRSSRKGRKRGKKRREDFQTEECLKTGQLKRKAGKNGCLKPRKCSKSSPCDVTKKSMSSILEKFVARMNQGVMLSWGIMRKRRGGRRRRASNSFFLAELASL